MSSQVGPDGPVVYDEWLETAASKMAFALEKMGDCYLPECPEQEDATHAAEDALSFFDAGPDEG